MTTFRVHFVSGEKREVAAATAADAGKIAAGMKLGAVAKIKVVRG